MIHFRPVQNTDAGLIEKWTEADEVHRGTPIQFWTEQPYGVQILMVEDETGPVMSMRFEPCIRIIIQFPTENVGKIRVAKALIQALPIVSNSSRDKGYQELLFDSTSNELIKFLEKLGFEKRDDVYQMKLT